MDAREVSTPRDQATPHPPKSHGALTAPRPEMHPETRYSTPTIHAQPNTPLLPRAKPKMLHPRHKPQYINPPTGNRQNKGSIQSFGVIFVKDLTNFLKI